ncbi:amino acid adenylation domain-containing protein [Amycolatopsis sp. lyj-346]|uniref:amino acid adenylation domain-containing protein n=1 Tax=Amycolatopsis sp. lyj-346 TaxID=2789289 RepID=UPI00397BA406
MNSSALSAAAFVCTGTPAEPGIRLYTEDTGLASTDERAARLRRRIMRRPLDHRRGPGTRLVLLRYADGVQHLIVSAHASAMDLRGVRRLGARLTSSPLRACTRPAEAAHAVDELPLDWARIGAPGPAGVAVRTATIRAGVDVADVCAAAAVVLGRYTGAAVVPIGVAWTGGRGVLAVELDERASRAELRDSVRLPGAALPEGAGTPAVTVDPADVPTVDEWRSGQSGAVELRLGGTELDCHYRTDLVHPAAAEALLVSIAAVLDVDERDAVGAVELVPAAAGRSDIAVDPATTIASAVIERAAEAPDSIAVCAADAQLTYRELVRQADGIASGLASAGVHRGDRVGVAMAPSARLIAVLLGVLRAGAAYVPLDPAYPRQRLSFTASDAGLAVVIAQDSVPIDTDAPVLSAESVSSAKPVRMPRTTADDDAYVIYTSGSTGTPKGVLVTHRNVLSLLAATGEYGFGPRDVWTLFHSCAFDFSVWEIWACLTTGGRLVVVPRDTARDPHAFHRLLRREHVTVLNQTPSAFAQLAVVDPGAEPLLVRLLIFGGEPLDPKVLRDWIGRYPQQRVVNMYGITETTVHCTWKVVDAEAVETGSRSIGAALPGWTVSVRDRRGRRLPVGVPGEIHVEGAGVTRGYLGRAALTAQRFTAGPGGTRRYRSGDQGRLLPSGELEHLGRLDSQVKIRGHRIELGEVRAALLRDPSVVAVAVVVREREDAYLAAYVVGNRANPAALRDRLAAELPEHCLPRSIVRIDALPTTPNGKLDAGRLPDPGDTAPDADPGDGDGRGAEEWLMALWRRLLGKPVSREDNLFLLGGTSLLAFRTAIEARAAGFGELSVKDVYRLRTARDLATIMTGKD